MKQEKSCGAVIAALGKPRKYLLIQHRNGGHWAFPKGHVEGNETERETALREIMEETGLAVTLNTDFRMTTKYSPAPGIEKEVVYFAAYAEHQRVTVQQEEVLQAGFFVLAEALKKVTHENDRDILKAADKFFEKLS